MLTVSVAVYNPNLKHWESFIRTLTENTPELSQLLIIDNASDVEHKIIISEIVNKYCPDITTLIINDENVGFGSAHNQVLPLVKNSFLAIVNDDVEFISVWSTAILKEFENPNVAQVSVKPGQCNMLKEDGGGQYIDDLLHPEYCEGSLFIIRTDIAREVGLFDEIYEFAYFEDSDLSLRLRKEGWELRCVRINWVHHAHETFLRVGEEKVNVFKEKNHQTFLKRWGDYLKDRSFENV